MSLCSLMRNFRTLTTSTASIHIQNACCFSSKLPPQGVLRERDPESGVVKTKKVSFIPKISLISGNLMMVTTLQEAEKLARRRELRLVKVTDHDTKTMRPVYQLMTGAEYHAEDMKQRELRKQERQHIRGEKVLLINARIAPHDLATQMRRAHRWLKRQYEVRVIISGVNGKVELSEKVYATIEQYLQSEEKEARIVQKRSRGTDIRFQIVPPKSKETNTNNLSVWNNWSFADF